MVLSPLKLRKRQSRARNGLSGYERFEWFGLVMISSNGYKWLE